MWVLLIFIYASTMSKGDSVALQAIYGMESKEYCIQAGKEITSKFSTFMKSGKFICLKSNQDTLTKY